ncbi:helix-turn-helix domain-containing protein [Ruminococcaceae bacterium OttesenSCG-928-D13]|nr:helix-turn-helix domain-containing protein [Ruminococcaceae bacterium OttesenSCG-928-D13]
MEEKNTSELLSQYPDVLNFNQLCEILQIGRDSAYRLLKENKIKHARVGKKYVISKLSIFAFLHGSK